MRACFIGKMPKGIVLADLFCFHSGREGAGFETSHRQIRRRAELIGSRLPAPECASRL
jgi:hypothetical protein